MPDHRVFSPGFLPPSALPGVTFPSLLDPARLQIVALLAQLAETQWWSLERLREHQLRQLGMVVRHAARTTAWGRARFPDLADGTLTWERYASLPVLTRRTVQAEPHLLRSDAVPKEHGKGDPVKTSGSTGVPIVVERTGLAGLFWNALTGREIVWQGRDTSQALGIIRFVPKLPQGGSSMGWGPAAAAVGPPGPAHVLHIAATTTQQIDWLLQRDIAYLLLYPSSLLDLVRATRARGIRFPRLRAVSTLGEVVTPELRHEVQQAWGVPIHDMYSTQELGYVGIQCPDHPHYHVQSEAVVVEVLRDDGTPCEPGEMGRVVATSLHNFAMPLVRYEVGDLAIPGRPCPCGRGLPVLERILGRVHNTFVTAEGDRIWLTVGVHRFPEFAPIVQHQTVQDRIGHVELRLVASRTPTPAEEEALRNYVQASLPAGTALTISWVDEIPRAPSGKFIDHVTLIR